MRKRHQSWQHPPRKNIPTLKSSKHVLQFHAISINHDPSQYNGLHLHREIKTQEISEDQRQGDQQEEGKGVLTTHVQ